MHSEHLVCPHGRYEGFFSFLSDTSCALESSCYTPGDFVVEDIYNGNFAKILTNAKFFVPVESFPICPH